MFRAVPMLVAVVLLAVSPCFGGVIVFNFGLDDGGFSAADPGVVPNWFKTGLDWRVYSGTSINRTLLSPMLTASGGPVTVTITHLTNFENGWDGGVLALQVVGSPIVRITDFSEWGYNDTSSAASFPSGNGGPAWTGLAQRDSVANAGSLSAGTEFVLRFEAAWDASVVYPNPNWAISSVTVSGVQSGDDGSAIPEPSTGVLLLAGAALLWRMKARKAN